MRGRGGGDLRHAQACRLRSRPQVTHSGCDVVAVQRPSWRSRTYGMPAASPQSAQLHVPRSTVGPSSTGGSHTSTALGRGSQPPELSRTSRSAAFGSSIQRTSARSARAVPPGDQPSMTIFVGLHGNASSMTDAVKDWQAVVDLGWLLVCTAVVARRHFLSRPAPFRHR